MNEERPEDRNVERDSQLSAMFDGELASAECELLARRLSRDEGLRAQWSRYAMIGAALRAERGVKLNDNVARRVQAVISQEATYGDSSSTEVAAGSTRSNSAAVAKVSSRWTRFARPAAGASIAAGVAAMSILWLRTQGSDPAVVADTAPQSESIILTPEPADTQITLAATQPQPEQPVSNGEPERYSTPAPSSQTSIAPPARFANYVVAHSEYSGPLARRMALLGIVGSDGQAETEGDTAAEPDTTPATAAPGAAANAH